MFWNTFDGANGLFKGRSVARDVSYARTPLSGRIAKGWFTFANLVVLYSQNAYDCASVVIRLPYGAFYENKSRDTPLQDHGHGGRSSIAKREAQADRYHDSARPRRTGRRHRLQGPVGRTG